jgi:hypothetical protein
VDDRAAHWPKRQIAASTKRRTAQRTRCAVEPSGHDFYVAGPAAHCPCRTTGATKGRPRVPARVRMQGSSRGLVVSRISPEPGSPREPGCRRLRRSRRRHRATLFRAKRPSAVADTAPLLGRQRDRSAPGITGSTRSDAAGSHRQLYGRSARQPTHPTTESRGRRVSGD